MPPLSQIPAWYWVVAAAFSVYYAFRGAVGNWFAFQNANAAKAEQQRVPRWVIVSVYSAHDALFHLVCSLAGFLAAFVAYGIYESTTSEPSVDASKSVLLVFCVLFGLVGVTGQLPQLIQQGKLPGLK